MNHSRRSFLALASGTAVATASGFPLGAFAKESLAERTQIALSQYSLRALLKDGSLDALDFPQFTVDTFGIKAIDLWEGGLPKDKLDDSAYLEKLRRKADAAGTDLFLLMTGALTADAAGREKSLATLMPSIDRARTLGADYLRIFLRAPGEDAAAAIAPCVEALKPLADAAAGKGVMIVIEPGASLLSSKGAFLARLMETLKHPNCKLMPDFGKQKENVYDGTEVIMPHAVSVSCKMHSFDDAGKQPDFDYPRLMKIIAASDYRGYLAIEWEGNKLKPVEGVKASKKLIEDSVAAAS